MAQKSILSFFKHTDKSNEKTIKETSIKANGSDFQSEQEKKKAVLCESDSPVKQSNKRKIRRIVESDDEEPCDIKDIPKETKKESNELNIDSPNNDENKKAPEKLQSAIVPKTLVKGEKSRQSVKRKKSLSIDSDEEENILSAKKEKLNSDDNAKDEDPKENTILNGHSSNEHTTANSSSPTSTCIVFIPKRKTARKQLRSTVMRKTTITDCKQPNESSNDNLDSLDCSLQSEGLNIDKHADNTSGHDVSIGDSAKEHSSDEETKKTQTNVKKIHPFFGGGKSDKNKDASNKSKTSKSKSNESEKVSENNLTIEEGKNEKCSTPKKEKAVKSEISKSSSNEIFYDPSVSHYNPIENAIWKRGEKVPYLALAKTLEIIEKTSGRLKTIEILSNFFRSVIVLNPSDLLYSIYLCLNRLAPEYEGIELGIGETLLMKAVAQATGRTVEKIKAEVASKGDLGLVAENSRGTQKLMFAPPKLSVFSVFSNFKDIAKMTGNSSMAKKIEKIKTLFVACRDCEAKYIIRSLSGKLRIGLAEQSVLAAISRAFTLTPPNQDYPPDVLDKSSGMNADSFKKFLDSQTLILKTTYCECPNYDIIVPVLLKEGIEALPKHCQLSPGRPLKPMLAHPTTGIDEVLKRFDKNEFTCEFKYDGERAQIHMNDDGEVTIYSRNQENNTSKYPDIIKRISKSLSDSTKSFILDTEAVAWDSESKQILPFQVLSTRKKKGAVESEIVVQVCIMAFDLLYLNGESLVKKSLKERRTLLHSSFNEIENEFMFVMFKDGNSAETMQEFLDESIKGNCEGLMVKALEVDASYEIAKRSHNWLKLKKDYLNGIGDTLDLVVIGGYYGKGKRTGMYGGFLLACYDIENEEFQSICKLGTGFDESELKTHSTFLKQHVIDTPKSYYRYDHSLEPDVWFDPVQIWEIKCADLSISPVHRAAIGIVDPEKGISLRFPRFLRIRDDKTKPEDATISSRIAELYEKQEQVQNTKNKNTKNEEDFY